MVEKEAGVEKFCFIISHIGEPNSPERIDGNRKLKHLFSPVLEELGYKSKRSDEEATPGFISTQIIKRLIDSKLVIADISFENANVFYELAVRHAIKKPSIIIKKPKQKPPFDITDIRAIDVDMEDPDIWQPAMKQLIEYIKESERDPEKASESILSNFTKSFNLQSADDKESDTLRTVKDIQAQLNRLSSDVNTVKNKSDQIRDSSFISTLPVFNDDLSPKHRKTLLFCKKCTTLFSPKYRIPSGIRDANIERCPNCKKESKYTKDDYMTGTHFIQ